jgi:hypothetical protein
MKNTRKFAARPSRKFLHTIRDRDNKQLGAEVQVRCLLVAITCGGDASLSLRESIDQDSPSHHKLATQQPRNGSRNMQLKITETRKNRHSVIVKVELQRRVPDRGVGVLLRDRNFWVFIRPSRMRAEILSHN